MKINLNDVCEFQQENFCIFLHTGCQWIDNFVEIIKIRFFRRQTGHKPL